MRLGIVGTASGTHIGGSLLRASIKLGWNPIFLDIEHAWGRRHFLSSAYWRFGDRRPPQMRAYERTVFESCKSQPTSLLITTGIAPLSDVSLANLRRIGVQIANYSTDDPWNPVLTARWHLKALPEYDFVFTPRRSNIAQLKAIGCRSVEYLPFGYDESLIDVHDDQCGTSSTVTASEVLIVGGADSDRLSFVKCVIAEGLKPALVGGYWDRWRETEALALGIKTPQQVAVMTQKAKVTVILVRRANRDGHVMRSYEAAATGACMIVEDTVEHREIFGAEGESVRFFRTPVEAVRAIKELLNNDEERSRLASNVRVRIVGGQNTYSDRLKQMLAICTGKSQPW